MHEHDVVTGRTGANTARRERMPCSVSHSTAAGKSSTHRPTWLSDGSCTFGRDSGRAAASGRSRPRAPGAEPQDVLLHVLGLARVLAAFSTPSVSTQQAAQRTEVETADRDLLKAEDSEGTFGAHGAERYRSTEPPNQSRRAALRSTGSGTRRRAGVIAPPTQAVGPEPSHRSVDGHRRCRRDGRTQFTCAASTASCSSSAANATWSTANSVSGNAEASSTSAEISSGRTHTLGRTRRSTHSPRVLGRHRRRARVGRPRSRTAQPVDPCIGKGVEGGDRVGPERIDSTDERHAGAAFDKR